MEPTTSPQPIGYWLNRADAAITQGMSALLHETDCDRLGWQVLNVVSQSEPVAEATVLDFLKTNAQVVVLSTTLAGLLTKKWLSAGSEGLRLTPEGQRYHQQIGEQIARFRQQMTAGITPEAYQTTLRVLEQLVRNLER